MYKKVCVGQWSREQGKVSFWRYFFAINPSLCKTFKKRRHFFEVCNGAQAIRASASMRSRSCAEVPWLTSKKKRREWWEGELHSSLAHVSQLRFAFRENKKSLWRRQAIVCRLFFLMCLSVPRRLAYSKSRNEVIRPAKAYIFCTSKQF